MMAIMVAGAVMVEKNLAEEAVEDNLVTYAMYAEEKVAKAKVLAVAMDEEYIIETKGSTIKLTLPAS